MCYILHINNDSTNNALDFKIQVVIFLSLLIFFAVNFSPVTDILCPFLQSTLYLWKQNVLHKI